METQLLSAHSPADLDAAADLLRRGGLVAFPTETVYGLGALALEPLAVRAIYAAKGRAATNPLIVHVLGEDDARPLCARWPIEAQELVTRFWPGPLTIVLPRTDRVPDEVTGGGPTVAVRAPSHPAARALLARVRAPLAAPSANRSEHVSPTTARHVLRDLNGRLDAVVDGGRCPVGIESTVLALTPQGPRLLRAGAVARAQLEELLGEVPDASASSPVPASPGQGKRHYAPAALVRIAPASSLPRVAADMPRPVGALLRSDVALSDSMIALRLPSDPAGYARDLYAAMRDLEDRGCTSICIESVPSSPEWDAIRDRLTRAAG
ncbi:MAG TPA: L-threonylcarbamoyladenylate synthase [Myxococcales bacterium]|nr:L-threonylcarbamoyladenylate synthase [Myxococcales bacterium]